MRDLISRTVSRSSATCSGCLYQHRNLGTLMAQDMPGDGLAREGWHAGVEQFREFLVGWWGYHTTPSRPKTDFITLLLDDFQKVFPGTRFVGMMPRGGVATPRANDFYFLIDRDGRVYDLAEMSSGEQAVFPLVYEFVRPGHQTLGCAD